MILSSYILVEKEKSVGKRAVKLWKIVCGRLLCGVRWGTVR
jgi:hypothetical protein